ncbi:MAG: dTMP kinase [Deltaproteobacteria bacterium]|nr:dTMP kinase [Deltaproteobacteria bacterium]
MFITFEGIEGCGKSTQVKRLGKVLAELGIEFISTFEPGGTRIGQKIRRILLDPENHGLTPLAELLLYAADRAQHVEEVIRPALEAGKWVICDRFTDATLVYQGAARGQDMEMIRVLNDKVTHGISPDITFLLDCPEETGLKRARARISRESAGDQDRFEREEMAFHGKVRQAYLELARSESKRFIVIDGTMPKEDVAGDILRHLVPHLERAKGKV